MIFITPDQIEEVIREFQTLGEPYSLVSTTSSRKLISGIKKYQVSDFCLGPGALNWIMKVKREVLENGKELDFSESNKPFPFFEVSEYLTGPHRKNKVSHFEACNEIDLNHAYWFVAKELNLISEETYQKFLTFKTKKLRLIALGSVAKTERIENYSEEGRLLGVETKVDPLGKQIFRRISFEVASEMKRLSSEYSSGGFFFYWFDNIFFTPLVKEISTRFLYSIRETTLNYNRDRFLYLIQVGKRVFQIPAPGIKGFTGTPRGLQVSHPDINWNRD